ncbi:hypothetical protein PFISCL1PPCAC_25834, partial [Pristionchus fissidentatus]
AVKPPRGEDVPMRLTPCGYLPIHRPLPMNDDYNIYGDLGQESQDSIRLLYYCRGNLVNANTKVEEYDWVVACDTTTNQFIIYDHVNTATIEPIKAGDKFYCRNKRCGPASWLQSDTP